MLVSLSFGGVHGTEPLGVWCALDGAPCLLQTMSCLWEALGPAQPETCELAVLACDMALLRVALSLLKAGQ
jgi:hypothetical protein